MPRATERGKRVRALFRHTNRRMKFRRLRQSRGVYSQLQDNVDRAYVKAYTKQLFTRYDGRENYRLSDRGVFDRDLSDATDDENIPCWLKENEFMVKYRMSRESFWALVDLIKDHPVFKRGKRGPKQAPPEHQLMVLLNYLGYEGNGGSSPGMRNVFDIGRGTIELYKDRTLKAILSLRSRVVFWPDEAERRAIARRIQKEYNFPHCVGFVDGSLLPLAFAPQTKDAADYSGRKHAYSFNVMIICDDQRLVRSYLSGWPGSTHDNRVFKNMDQFEDPKSFFGDTEYLLGDCAFQCEPFMVPSYKKTAGQSLTREKMIFNDALSKPRAKAEQCIGILKGRFPWLRSIRNKITKDRKTRRKILRYIDATIILHNLLVTQTRDDMPDDSQVREQEGARANGRLVLRGNDDELNQAIPETAPRDERRQQLTERLSCVHIMGLPRIRQEEE